LGDQQEFIPFLNLYAFYEVIGMKAELTTAPNFVTGAGIYAGMAPGFTNNPTTPVNDILVRLPLQVKGNTQG